MSGARWFAGTATSVEDDGLYGCDYATREEAVAAGTLECEAGGYFYLIHAIPGELGDDDDPDYGVPFAQALSDRQRIDVDAVCNGCGSDGLCSCTDAQWLGRAA